MRQRSLILGLFAVAALVAFGGLNVSAEDLTVSAAQIKLFETHVRPVLVANCIKCHGPEKQKGKLRLDSRAAAVQGGESGAAVVPGSPDKSLLIEAVRRESFEMPPDKKLGQKRNRRPGRLDQSGRAVARRTGICAAARGQDYR